MRQRFSCQASGCDRMSSSTQLEPPSRPTTKVACNDPRDTTHRPALSNMVAAPDRQIKTVRSGSYKAVRILRPMRFPIHIPAKLSGTPSRTRPVKCGVSMPNPRRAGTCKAPNITKITPKRNMISLRGKLRRVNAAATIGPDSPAIPCKVPPTRTAACRVYRPKAPSFLIRRPDPQNTFHGPYRKRSSPMNSETARASRLSSSTVPPSTPTAPAAPTTIPAGHGSAARLCIWVCRRLTGRFAITSTATAAPGSTKYTSIGNATRFIPNPVTPCASDPTSMAARAPATEESITGIDMGPMSSAPPRLAVSETARYLRPLSWQARP